MPTDQPEFVLSDTWFECWRGAFASQTHNVWQGRSGKRLHYIREARNVAGLRLDVFRSATNQQTARFDIVTEEPTVGPEFASELLEDTGADLLELDFLSPSSKALQALQSGAVGQLLTTEMIARSPYVDCRGSFDEWLKTRSFRKTWRQKERRAIGDLGMTVALFEEPGEVASAIDEVLAVDECSWKGEVGGALKQQPAMVEFYSALATAAAAAGALRLHVLRHEGRTIAFEFGLVSNGTSYGLKKGYLPDYAKSSPGIVLMLQALRAAFADPELERYDLLGGTPRLNAAKASIATNEEFLYRARVFAPTPRGRLAYLAYQSGHRLRQTVRPLWLWYKTNLGAARRVRSTDLPRC